MRRFISGLALLVSLATTPTVVMAENDADTMMAQTIASNFKTSGRLQKYSLGVKCKDGTALLKGTVASERQLRTALDIARATPGVTRIINEMTTADGGTTMSAPAQRRQPPAMQQPRRMEVPASLEEPAYSGPELDMSAAAPPAAQYSPAATEPQFQARPNRPLALARRHGAVRHAAPGAAGPMMVGDAMAAGAPMASGVAQARFDQPHMPNYAWPSYASYPNYAAVTYPQQYSPTAWPYIGPFYPYPQVPLGWRKVTLEWDDGWWQLDFKSK